MTLAEFIDNFIDTRHDNQILLYTDGTDDIEFEGSVFKLDSRYDADLLSRNVISVRASAFEVDLLIIAIQ